MVYRGILIALFTVAVAFLTPLGAQAQDVKDKNEALLDATSPFEDIAEFALAKNDAGIQKQLLVADKQTASVKQAMSAEGFKKYASLLAKLKTSAAEKAHLQAADCAVELFRVLIDGLEPSKLDVPKEVSLLDYAGFKIHVLTAAEHPDWTAVQKTAQEAAEWWSTIKGKVKNKKLGDAVSSTIRGLQDSAKSKNLPMVNFAAQLDLDLVDLLEAEFEK